MGKCVIIGGAPIARHEELKKYLAADDYCIYCDCGLRHMEGLGKKPDLIIGDFDSSRDPHMSVETITLPVAKDDTDTVYAVKEALHRGFDEFLLLGVVGARFDHSLGNVSALLMLEALGKKAVIVDDYSEMQVISGGVAFVEPEFPYFSLLNISGEAKGINIENAKFPLKAAEISCEYQYGISNEPLPGMAARISLERGRLLLVKVRGD